MAPRYQDIEVRLIGKDGNAFAVIAEVAQAMERAGVSEAEHDAFVAEAWSGDYLHLMEATERWVVVL